MKSLQYVSINNFDQELSELDYNENDSFDAYMDNLDKRRLVFIKLFTNQLIGYRVDYIRQVNEDLLLTNILSNESSKVIGYVKLADENDEDSLVWDPLLEEFDADVEECLGINNDIGNEIDYLYQNKVNWIVNLSVALLAKIKNKACRKKATKFVSVQKKIQREMKDWIPYTIVDK